MIEIRSAFESDAETLAVLGSATFTETFAKDNRKEDIDLYVSSTFSPDKQLEEIRDPNRRIFIAWDGREPAGYLHLLKGQPDACVTGPKPIEILRLYANARWHGKGLGAALMERAIQTARNEDRETLWLGVWERNLRAQAFYAKYGFRKVGSHIFRVGTDDQTDFILVRSV